MALRNAGVVNGVTADAFNPLGQVRRDQMATFIAQFYENVLGEPLAASTVDAFVDDEGNVHERNINAIAAADIADGFTATQYGPNHPVTRGQMAAFFVRALDLTETEGGTDFTDTDNSIFEEDILKLSASGITRGCNPPDNTRFCPDELVTRGQMAAFLHRAADRF